MKKVHFMGIGGSGGSAVAAIASSSGFDVTGCDKIPHNEFTTHFDPGRLSEGHSAEHLKALVIARRYDEAISSTEDEIATPSPTQARNDDDFLPPPTSELIDILAVSPAILSFDPNNPEVQRAKNQGIEVITWQEFMGKYLEKDKYVIAVCGTHGKSTTTAMIGLMLEEAGLDPTVELGTIVPKWGANYRIGTSKFFVTEADEFNDNFLVSHPDITVVTTIEMDHPEYFADFETLKQSYRQFFNQTKGKIIANLSDEGVRSVLEIFQKDKEKPHHPEIIDYSKSEIMFDLKVPGEFNKLNATAVMQVGLSFGISPETIRQTLMGYTGISRRFELIGKYKDADIYSDFGHHPTEIRVTIEAARNKFKDRRLVVVFQPHMFSRTRALFDDFVQVLQQLPADQIYITDIYPSREVDTGLVSSKELTDAINKEPSPLGGEGRVRGEQADGRSIHKVTYLGSIKDAENFLKVAIRPHDVVFFQGAGDIDSIARNLAIKS